MAAGDRQQLDRRDVVFATEGDEVRLGHRVIGFELPGQLRRQRAGEGAGAVAD
jgi:hypothetical protein